MKKYMNIALKYAVAAMVWGVFYREFTKWNGFSGDTVLGKIHGHMFLLGMIVFLVIGLYAERFPIEKEKTFTAFMWVYNIGVPLTALMMVIRGIFQVLGTQLSAAADAAVSGIAGIGHILTGTGIILLLIALKKSVSKKEICTEKE